MARTERQIITTPGRVAKTEKPVGQVDKVSSELDDYTPAEQSTAELNFLLGEYVGRRKLTKAMRALSDVADLEFLQYFKDKKTYFGVFTSVKGEVVRCSSWDGFCKDVLDLDRTTVDQRLTDLQTFGAEAYDALQGLSLRQLRSLRRAASTEDRQRLMSMAASRDTTALADEAEAIIAREKAAADSAVAEANERAQAEIDTVKKEADDKVSDAESRLKVMEQLADRNRERANKLQGEVDVLEGKYEVPKERAEQIKKLRDLDVQIAEVLHQLDTTWLAVLATDGVGHDVQVHARLSLDSLAKGLLDRAFKRGVALSFDDPRLEHRQKALDAALSQPVKKSAR